MSKISKNLVTKPDTDKTYMQATSAASKLGAISGDRALIIWRQINKKQYNLIRNNVQDGGCFNSHIKKV